MRKRKQSLVQRIASNKIAISVFFVLIMVTSILGIILGGYTQEKQKLEYNGYLFVREEGYWTVNVRGEVIKSYSFPTELDFFEVDESAVSRLESSQMVYVSIPTQGSNLDYIGLASYELAEFLSEHGVYAAITISDNNTGYQLPLIGCENATEFVPVVRFNMSNESRVRLEDNCILVDAQTGYDFVRLKDRVVLEFMGIM